MIQTSVHLCVTFPPFALISCPALVVHQHSFPSLGHHHHHHRHDHEDDGTGEDDDDGSECVSPSSRQHRHKHSRHTQKHVTHSPVSCLSLFPRDSRVASSKTDDFLLPPHFVSISLFPLFGLDVSLGSLTDPSLVPGSPCLIRSLMCTSFSKIEIEKRTRTSAAARKERFFRW